MKTYRLGLVILLTGLIASCSEDTSNASNKSSKKLPDIKPPLISQPIDLPSAGESVTTEIELNPEPSDSEDSEASEGLSEDETGETVTVEVTPVETESEVDTDVDAEQEFQFEGGCLGKSKLTLVWYLKSDSDKKHKMTLKCKDDRYEVKAKFLINQKKDIEFYLVF